MDEPIQRARRKRLRLRGYDYSSAGLYFVTVCVKGMACILGEVRESRMFPNALGEIVQEEWAALEARSPWVRLDAFVAMPNHVHGIVVIERGEEGPESGRGEVALLSSVVGAFKSAAARRMNLMRGTPGRAVWQRGFYEHIVRSEKALERIRGYIDGNPAAWGEDRYHPRWRRARKSTSTAGGVNPAPTTTTADGGAVDVVGAAFRPPAVGNTPTATATSTAGGVNPAPTTAAAAATVTSPTDGGAVDVVGAAFRPPAVGNTPTATAAKTATGKTRRTGS